MRRIGIRTSTLREREHVDGDAGWSVKVDAIDSDGVGQGRR